MRKPKLFFDPVLKQEFYLFINWPVNEYESYCIKNFGESPFDADGGYAGHTSAVSDGSTIKILIWLSKRNPELASHECFHAAGICMNWHGIKYDPKNDEPFAYLLGKLVEVCYER